MSKQMAPLSIRLEPEMKARLEDAAGRIGISPHGLAQLAVEAGIEAVEAEGGTLALPIRFQTTHKVVAKTTETKGDALPSKTGLSHSQPSDDEGKDSRSIKRKKAA